MAALRFYHHLSLVDIVVEENVPVSGGSCFRWVCCQIYIRVFRRRCSLRHWHLSLLSIASSIVPIIAWYDIHRHPVHAFSRLCKGVILCFWVRFTIMSSPVHYLVRFGPSQHLAQLKILFNIWFGSLV